jgi:hypothetical protein
MLVGEKEELALWIKPGDSTIGRTYPESFLTIFVDGGDIPIKCFCIERWTKALVQEMTVGRVEPVKPIGGANPEIIVTINEEHIDCVRANA